MASTWSALKIELLETGANSGTWGTATNVNLGDAVLGEAITGQATVDFATDADVTITLTDSASTQAARNLRLNITESSTGVGSVRNLILGSGCQIEKFYLINNTGTGAKTVKNTSGTGIAVPAGKATLVYNNGTNVVDAASYFSSLTLGSALPVASGGTGLTSTPANGALDIGNGTGFTRTTLTQGSGITITNASGAITIAATADVVGPASSTDNAFARFDSTTGKLLQNSTGATLSDTGAAVFTGALDVLGNSTAGSNLKLYEDTDNGTNYVSFKAPDTIAANVTWTLPAADGTNTQVLSTNGSGVLSFATVSGSATPAGSNTQVQYNNAGAFGGITGATTNGTALTLTGAILNGTIGATTPSTGAFTTLSATGTTVLGAATGYGSRLDVVQSGTSTKLAIFTNTTDADFEIKSTAAGVMTIGPNTGLLTFQTSGVERARIPAAGGFQAVGSISVGNVTPGNGAGITFPATQSASSDANTLDDYEEGTWTPTVGGTATYSTQTGSYTKIGRQVTVNFEITITTLGTGSTTTISGLPFSVVGAAGEGRGATGYFSGLAVNVIALTCYAGNGTSSILFNMLSSAGSTSNQNPAIFGNSARVQGSVTYFTT